MSCVIEGCQSHSGRKENSSEKITFHRFPKNETIRKEWIRRTSKRNWTPKTFSRICSIHFSEDSFVPNTNIKWRRLKHNALPTLHLANYKSMKPEEIQNMDVCETKQIKVQKIPSTTTQVHLCELEAQGYHEDPLMRSHTTRISSGESRCSEYEKCQLKVAEYKKRNSNLQREVTRLKGVTKQRLKKINALKKQISRLGKKNSNLYSILMEKLKEECVEKENQIMEKYGGGLCRGTT